jgi:hypothetical protein
MSIESILLENTILKFLEVKIDNFVILKDEIASLEVKYNFFDFKIVGKIKFKDSFDMANAGLAKISNDNKLTISAMDKGDTKTFRTFRIVNSNVIIANERTKVYDIDFQDEISWILQNTFTTVPITGSPVKALVKYLNSGACADVLVSDKIKIDYTDTAMKRTLTAPQNQNILEFLTYALRKDNIRLYQDRTTIYIKEVKPAEYPTVINDETGTDLVFSNDVQDNLYLFKIHDFMDLKNNTEKVNKLSPVIKVNSSTSPKGQSTVTISLTDFFKDLQLNDMELGSIQFTTGEKLETSEELAVGWQKAKLFETFMLNQQMFIAVKGTYKYSNIGTIISTKMKGSVASNEGTLEGDRLTSGNYFVFGVSDRYLGDKMIQRLHLGRLDAQKVREKK